MDLVTLGRGFLGSMIFNNEDELSVYHSQISNRSRSQIHNYYAERRNKSKTPEESNIISPLYKIESSQVNANHNINPAQTYAPYQNLEMGTTTDIPKPININENFSNKFELQKFRDTSIFANNEIDDIHEHSKIANVGKWATFEEFTTKDLRPTLCPDQAERENINKKCKFQPNTTQRDFQQFNDTNEQLAPLEVFTGSSKNYYPKKEVETFFQPNIFTSRLQNKLNEFEPYYKESVSIEKRHEKPFEPQRVGPGIGLPTNKDSLGGYHDTARILPKTINDLRRKDMPQISYEPDTVMGKRGEKMPVFAPNKKRLPDKYVEYNKDNYLMGQTTVQVAPMIRDNINLRVGNRVFYKKLDGGPAHDPLTVKYNPQTQGEFMKSSKPVLAAINTDVPANAKILINNNIKSYDLAELERDTTNIQYLTVVPNGMQRVQKYDKNDIAKNTIRQVIIENPNMGYTTMYNKTETEFTDNAKQTLKQVIPEFPLQFGTKDFNKGEYQFTDKAKSNIKQVNANFPEPAFGTNNFSKADYRYIDKARTNMKQVNSDFPEPQFATRDFTKTETRFNDLAKNNIRQVNSDFPEPQFATNNFTKTETRFSDLARTNMKQINSDFPEQQFATKDYTKTETRFTDLARTNMKQVNSDFPELQFATSNFTKTEAQFADLAKTNMKQVNSDFPDPGFGGRDYTKTEAQFADIARTNMKQVNSDFPDQAFGGRDYNKTQTAFADLARTTMKQQDIELPDKAFGGRDYNKTQAAFADLARSTIKQQDIEFPDKGFGSGDYNKPQYFNPNDLFRNTTKQMTIELPDGSAAPGQIFKPGHYTYQTPQATMKQITDTDFYVSSGGYSFAHNEETNYKNAVTNTVKETILEDRLLPQSGTPMLGELGYTKMNIPINFYENYEFMPTETKKIDTQRVDVELYNRVTEMKQYPYYDDRVDDQLLNMLNKNPFVNNIVKHQNRKN
jgi:uncharacterized protein YjbI with pentapeptide repeats